MNNANNEIELTWDAHFFYGQGQRSNEVLFGIRDRKGREVGGFASFVTHTHDGTPLTTFLVMTHATRGGKPFGALPTKGTIAYSIEEAKKIAVDKLRAAAKRQAAKAAKGEI